MISFTFPLHFLGDFIFGNLVLRKDAKNMLLDLMSFELRILCWSVWDWHSGTRIGLCVCYCTEGVTKFGGMNMNNYHMDLVLVFISPNWLGFFWQDRHRRVIFSQWMCSVRGHASVGAPYVDRVWQLLNIFYICRGQLRSAGKSHQKLL